MYFFSVAIFSETTEMSLPFPDDQKLDVKNDKTDSKEVYDDFQIEIKNLESQKESEKLLQEKKEPLHEKSNLPKKEIQESNLPNQKTKKSKKKDQSKKSENIDESLPPYERGMIQLQRSQVEKSKFEFKESIAKEKDFSFKSKLEEIRLLGIEKKIEEAKNLAISIENPDEKYEALFVLARSLDKDSDKKTLEEAVSIYSTITTDAPRSNQTRQKTLWAISHLLFRMEDYKTSLYFLSDILKNHKDSENYPKTLYLLGKIFSSPWSGKDEEKSKKYYEKFMQNSDEEKFRKSEYFDDVKKSLDTL